MKNSSDNIGNRTRDLPACSVVPQPTTLPRALTHIRVQIIYIYIYLFIYLFYYLYLYIFHGPTAPSGPGLHHY